jgi:hypothetical protein
VRFVTCAPTSDGLTNNGIFVINVTDLFEYKQNQLGAHVVKRVRGLAIFVLFRFLGLRLAALYGKAIKQPQVAEIWKHVFFAG